MQGISLASELVGGGGGAQGWGILFLQRGAGSPI